MSRVVANRADELLAAPEGANTRQNVQAYFDTTDDETPGVVALASTNAIANPDLVDEDGRGRTRGYLFGAPPTPDSWNVYMRRIARHTGVSTYTPLDNPTPMLRQNQEVLRSTVHTYQHDHPLLTDKSLPDLKDPEPSDLAAPTEKPRTDVLDAPGNGGYPNSPGGLWTSYCGILGNNPMTSSRLTAAAPPVLTGAIGPGQNLQYFVPDEIPASWSGIAFVAGPNASDMRVQKKVDLRDGSIIPTVIDRGSYRRDGFKVNTSEDRTYMGKSGAFGAPKVWRAHATRDLTENSYELSYKLVTKQGPTASQPIAHENVAVRQNGEAVCWLPPKEAVRQPGIIAWIPEFRNKEGKWFTFHDAKGGGIPLSRAAKLHTPNTDKDKWTGAEKPAPEPRTTKDRSGAPAPTDAMETPIAVNRSHLTPGRYVVRVTNASEKDDLESRPSPRSDPIDVPDTGIAGGGAASSVTDSMIRVFRPQPQTIRNARFMEFTQAGAPNLHWSLDATHGVGGVSIAEGDGTITIGDTAGSTTTYRRTALERIDPLRYYTMRWRMVVNSRSSGTINVVAQFFQANGTTPASNPSTVLESFFTTGDQGHVHYTLGPNDGAANYDIPSNAAFVRIAINGPGVHNFTMTNIGMFIGRSHPRKVYDLVLAEDTPGKDVWPVPDETDDSGVPTNGKNHAQMHYPPGPYCRVVTAPADGPTSLNYSVIESKYFEDNSLTSNGWTAPAPTAQTNFSLSTIWAFKGAYSARADATSSVGSNYNALIWKSFLNASRNTFGLLSNIRIKSLPAAGTSVGVLGVTRNAGLLSTDYLAYAQINSGGVVTLRYYDGTATLASQTLGLTVAPGDDLRVELSFTGLRTTSGKAKLRVKRNDRTAVSFETANQPWGSANVNRAVVGFILGSSTGAARMLYDGVRVAEAEIIEGGTPLPGNMVEYFAPEGQPPNDPDHFVTGMRWPVQPNETRVFSWYMRYMGVTTPADGASVFRIVSFDAEGKPTKDHGFAKTGILGKDHWDRYSFAYTTPSDASYVEVTRNDVGDGVFQAGWFQDEATPGTTPSAWTNTNTGSGFFTVIFKTSFTGGDLDGDTSFTDSFRRMRANVTHAYNDTTGAQLSTVALTARSSSVYNPTTKTLVSPTAYTSDVTTLSPSHEYIQVRVDMTCSDFTKSPEIRGVFVDIKRNQPVVCYEDGRDFHGGILAYELTPESPIPNVVRKELANGSIGLENVGRDIPKKLKLSLAALTPLGKWQVERNPATDMPLFVVDTENTRYLIAMMPEFTGATEATPDGTSYYDYTAEGIEADVMDSMDA